MDEIDKLSYETTPLTLEEMQETYERLKLQIES
jgi:hypothetical protein